MESKPHLLELLRSQELPELIASMTALLRAHAVSAQALVTPKGMVATRAFIPEEYRDDAATLVDLCVGGQKAERLGKAQKDWIFTSVGAEQSTHPDIARVHAAMFDGCELVVEVCTGSGVDTQAIASQAKRVVSFESDAVAAALAQGNHFRAGVRNVDVIHAAVPCDEWQAAMEQADGLWADPSRRTPDGRRTRSIAHHDPPLALLTTHTRIAAMRAVGIKLGPADDVPSELMQGMYRQYIGSGHECKELVLRNGNPSEVWATLVNGAEVRSIRGIRKDQEYSIQTWDSGSPHKEHNAVHSTTPVLLEPHATLIASGLLGAVYKRIGAEPIDPHIAYGITQQDPGATPWWTRFRIVAVDDGVSEKRMQVRIREFEWNLHTEFKKRGWPRDPEELRRALRFAESDHHGVVLIVRVGDGHRTYYAERLE
ncbi:hypothetical protein BH10BAC6_BH10BAC6_03420 [soil metagenome]